MATATKKSKKVDARGQCVREAIKLADKEQKLVTVFVNEHGDWRCAVWTRADNSNPEAQFSVSGSGAMFTL